MASPTKENVGLSTSSFMASDSLFKAFAPSDQTIATSSNLSPSRPPAGSRLVQYMQPQSRKLSTTPVNGPSVQNGPLFDPAVKEKLLSASFVPSAHPMSIGPSTSFHASVNPSVTPPTQGFSQLNVSPRHTNEFVPGKMMHQSVSQPAFIEAPQMGFVPLASTGYVASRDTPTPPGKRRLNKSPIVGGQEPPFVQESIGGTMYFYNPEDQQSQFPSQQNPEPRGQHSALSQHGAEFMGRQMLSLAQVDPEQHPDLPQEVESYHQLAPLEPLTKSQFPERPGFFLHYSCSTYKAVSKKDGLVYCLRRLHNCRLVNPRCLTLIDTWKKLFHSGVVQLREMCTTKSFGDFSLIYVYDYHPGAETLKYRHFSGLSKAHSLTHALYEEFDSFGVRAQTAGKLLNGGGGSLSESLIWSYVVQLSSALRTIHSAGLAARTMEPSKILVVGRSKLMVNCCGMMDVLTYEQTQHNLPVAIQHFQQEDLVGLGRIVVALACSSLGSASRENLASSIAFIAQNYSQDLKNLVTYLLSPVPGRMRNINDIMPMIGARFYAQLDSSQMRIDMLENELSKEVENGRLFRLLCKLGTLNERPEYNMDPTWSETGDRYLLKLFRDYLFHQVTEDGRPWIDMAHVVQCLNKVDAGSQEKLSLMSRDEQNVLVVSYADLKRCMEQAFQELTCSDGISRAQ